MDSVSFAELRRGQLPIPQNAAVSSLTSPTTAPDHAAFPGKTGAYPAE